MEKLSKDDSVIDAVMARLDNVGQIRNTRRDTLCTCTRTYLYARTCMLIIIIFLFFHFFFLINYPTHFKHTRVHTHARRAFQGSDVWLVWCTERFSCGACSQEGGGFDFYASTWPQDWYTLKHAQPASNTQDTCTSTHTNTHAHAHAHRLPNCATLLYHVCRF